MRKMPEIHPKDNEFLRKITGVIEKHLANEQFGVSELAHEVGMSRSNLLRKVKKNTGLSVSQFIRQVRLQQAMDILRETSSNVSEVAFQVGFSSTSYFIKCFHDYYGHPPGEVVKGDYSGMDPDETGQAHKLAAIMFTDIQGYTALMQQDEAKAVAFRSRHRAVFNESTKKFRGRILQYYGDGTLSTFHSAIDAVRCAIELQLAYREEPRIPVRIGIHSGDIIFTEDDIIGDGVNVASRIESLSVPQSIFISEKVYDEVKNQAGIKTVSMGQFELKNVGKPMEVFAVSNPGLVIPPKEEIQGKLKNESHDREKAAGASNKARMIRWSVIGLVVVVAFYLLFTTNLFEKARQILPNGGEAIAKKSIAVLPFINDSNDSTNVYLVNGLMESILNNLQKIEDLRVISRTSVEKYRARVKTSPEIARELNVKYLIEGSGQKIGDRILLNIQLIEAATDQHIWSEQFARQVTDIFSLQQEVAGIIADKIEVFITPEEKARISEVPTENMVAYDYFLKGRESMLQGTREGLEEAIVLFEKAIAEDPGFANAYAEVAISYYYLDLYQEEKIHTEEINSFSDKALLYNPKLSQSLIAKALFYMTTEEYEQAVPYLQGALKVNPNEAVAVNLLSELYTSYIPDSEKYLQYALKGIELDIASHDSTMASFIYLHVSNAFIQTGFVKEARKYIDASIRYNPDNLYSAYVDAYIGYAEDKNLLKAKDQLVEVFQRDTTRLDVMQEVAKLYYYLGDYEKSWTYYKPFTETRKAWKLDIYPGEDAKIGLVMEKVGLETESDSLFQRFYTHAQSDHSIYRHLSFAAYYAHAGETDKALEALKIFSEEENYNYWIVLLLDQEPLMKPIMSSPAFRKVFNAIETNFWEKNRQIKDALQSEGLI